MIYIIDCGSKKTPAIVHVVEEFGYQVKVISIDHIPSKFPDEAKAVIVSGSPVLLSKVETRALIEKFHFLNNEEFPVLGICFGHQIIGLHFGASVFLGNPVRKSVKIEVLIKDALFENIPENPVFLQDHTEGISLPENFVHIAKSREYQVEAMRHTHKNIYGVQFHPEVSPENGRILIGNFLRLIPNLL
ncbi:MAG: gamma-glutamyl-gamma-aminobutyrate hydrolase family protein [Bacteroidetes bacterium]|nr:gamma-glutamyl-gamma-aminobutyrate hydrolase family protein [Bacteroidota bacterium]HET6245609.1 gamma-glutamyl-gamma-aminobutyrate hydrolase family protein [Bacteroidia bacterium]